tara:strand:- start:63 stop:191 length:129 start_codon:yes stop_codon:yes gene_type:complete
MSLLLKAIVKIMNKKILIFNIRLPAIKLIGIKENKEFIKNVL